MQKVRRKTVREHIIAKDLAHATKLRTEPGIFEVPAVNAVGNVEEAFRFLIQHGEEITNAEKLHARTWDHRLFHEYVQPFLFGLAAFGTKVAQFSFSAGAFLCGSTIATIHVAEKSTYRHIKNAAKKQKRRLAPVYLAAAKQLGRRMDDAAWALGELGSVGGEGAELIRESAESCDILAHSAMNYVADAARSGKAFGRAEYRALKTHFALFMDEAAEALSVFKASQQPGNGANGAKKAPALAERAAETTRAKEKKAARFRADGKR